MARSKVEWPTYTLPWKSSVKLSQVDAEPVEWLWPGRIPLRAITMLDGDPGLGKSLVALDLVARITTGRVLPDGTYSACRTHPQGVVLLCAEDDLATTIRSRLIAARANLELIRAVRLSVIYDEQTGRKVGMRPLLLPRDIDEVESAVEHMNAVLVVVDPLMAYLEPRINSWHDQDVRTALAPVMDLARRGRLSFLLIRHLNKSASANARYRGGGSVGIIGTARSGLLVAPENPQHERILAVTKSNLGPPVPALRYRIESLSDDPFSQAIRIQWLGPTTHTAVSLLSQPAVEPEPSAVDEAMAFLREALREGERPAEEVKQEGRVLDITPATLKRARERLGVKSRREGFGRSGRWLWQLPAEAESGTPAAGQDGAGADERAG